MPLYTEAELRAHGKGQISDPTLYPTAAITAQEARTRAKFTAACHVDFLPTTHTDEYHDGDGSQILWLDWPKVSTVTAASIRSGVTWTALTAGELAQLQVEENGRVYWDGGVWPSGVHNIKVTYSAGYAAVPDLIKEAALDEAVDELPVANTPFVAESYEAGGTSYSWQTGDGFNGAWSRLPAVMLALRLYDHSTDGIG